MLCGGHADFRSTVSASTPLQKATFFLASDVVYYPGVLECLEVQLVDSSNAAWASLNVYDYNRNSGVYSFGEGYWIQDKNHVVTSFVNGNSFGYVGRNFEC